MTNLNDILGEYQHMGFSLKEPDGHVLELYFKDKRIAVLNQTKAEPDKIRDIIRDGCKNYTRNLLAQAGD